MEAITADAAASDVLDGPEWQQEDEPPPAAAGSPAETPAEAPPPAAYLPAVHAATPATTQPARSATPLDNLRAALQPIAHDLLADQAYWEMLKRTAAPRTFLEFVRFAFAADEKVGQGNNQQIIITAPFPRGPLDVLPAQMRID